MEHISPEYMLFLQVILPSYSFVTSNLFSKLFWLCIPICLLFLAVANAVQQIKEVSNMFTCWDANSIIHQRDDKKSLHGISKLINGCCVNLDLSWLFKVQNCHFLRLKRDFLNQASILKKNTFFSPEDDYLNFTCISKKTCSRSSTMFGLEKWNCIWSLTSSCSEHKKKNLQILIFFQEKNVLQSGTKTSKAVCA